MTVISGSRVRVEGSIISNDPFRIKYTILEETIRYMQARIKMPGVVARPVTVV
jgi:hypothetical protein